VAGSGAQIEPCRHWADRIASFGEPLAGKCERLICRIEVAAPASGSGGFRAGHGSYMPEHVILSGERTTTIDLDEYDVADPARDLAWFIVSLQRLALKHLGSLHSLDDAVQHFVETYAAAGPAGATAHLPFYRAVECLHRARRDLFKRVSPVREWAEIMLDEGLRLVAP
jgi:aminoglycoside phosphotransferase (APT) family kinase protein